MEREEMFRMKRVLENKAKVKTKKLEEERAKMRALEQDGNPTSKVKEDVKNATNTYEDIGDSKAKKKDKKLSVEITQAKATDGLKDKAKNIPNKEKISGDTLATNKDNASGGDKLPLRAPDALSENKTDDLVVIKSQDDIIDAKDVFIPPGFLPPLAAIAEIEELQEESNIETIGTKDTKNDVESVKPVEIKLQDDAVDAKDISDKPFAITKIEELKDESNIENITKGNITKEETKHDSKPETTKKKAYEVPGEILETGEWLETASKSDIIKRGSDSATLKDTVAMVEEPEEISSLDLTIDSKGNVITLKEKKERLAKRKSSKDLGEDLRIERLRMYQEEIKQASKQKLKQDSAQATIKEDSKEEPTKEKKRVNLQVSDENLILEDEKKSQMEKIDRIVEEFKEPEDEASTSTRKSGE